MRIDPPMIYAHSNAHIHGNKSEAVENRMQQCCWSNIVQCCQQYCSALVHLLAGSFRLNNIVQYCWQLGTMLPQQHCCILFSTTCYNSYFFCRVVKVCLRRLCYCTRHLSCSNRVLLPWWIYFLWEPTLPDLWIVFPKLCLNGHGIVLVVYCGVYVVKISN